MFRFENPAYLYLLLLIPILLAFYIYSNYKKREALRKYGDPEFSESPLFYAYYFW